MSLSENANKGKVCAVGWFVFCGVMERDRIWEAASPLVWTERADRLMEWVIGGSIRMHRGTRIAPSAQF